MSASCISVGYIFGVANKRRDLAVLNGAPRRLSNDLLRHLAELRFMVSVIRRGSQYIYANIVLLGIVR